MAGVASFPLRRSRKIIRRRRALASLRASWTRRRGNAPHRPSGFEWRGGILAWHDRLMFEPRVTPTMLAVGFLFMLALGFVTMWFRGVEF